MTIANIFGDLYLLVSGCAFRIASIYIEATFFKVELLSSRKIPCGFGRLVFGKVNLLPQRQCGCQALEPSQVKFSKLLALSRQG